MTTLQLQLIRETFPEVREAAGPLAGLFYGRLFQVAPAVRPMFRTDIGVQGRKFTEMLEALVEGLSDFDRHTAGLRAMGLRHAAYGVVPEHYDALSAAFLWALAQVLETRFNGDVKAAWAALISEVSATMKAGAAELTPKVN